MKCVKCGCNLEDDARFCYECGAAVEVSNVTESVASSQENVGQDMFVNPPPVQNTPNQQWNTKEEGVKTDTNTVSKVFLVCGGIIAVIFMLAAVKELISFFPALVQTFARDNRFMALFTLLSCVGLFLMYMIHFAAYLIYALGFAVIGIDFKKEKATSGFCMILIGVILEVIGSIVSFGVGMVALEELVFEQFTGIPSTWGVLSGSFSRLGDMLLYGAFMFALLSVAGAMPFASNNKISLSDALKNIPNDMKDTYASTKNRTASPKQPQQTVNGYTTSNMGMSNTCPPPTAGMNNACPPPTAGMNSACPPPNMGMNNVCPPPNMGMNNAYQSSNTGMNPNAMPVMIKMPLKSDRSLLMYILLNIVTCGIYSWFFIHKLAKDVNEGCAGDGKKTAGLLMYILLNTVTCGIYGWIWDYQLGNRLAENARRYNLMFSENGTTVLMWNIFGSLLCGIGPFIALNILIKNSNQICIAYNRMNNL